MAFRPNWYDDDGTRGRFWGRSPATWSGQRWIFTLTIGVFLLQYLEAGLLHSRYLTDLGALRAWGLPWETPVPDGSPGILNPFFPLQLLTYALLHADFMHIFFNMLFLYFFGPELEALHGRAGFLRLYVGGAVVGGLLQWFWYLVQSDPGSVIGASGAVFAVMVAFALRWPHRTILIWFILPVPVWAMVAVYMLVNLVGLMDVGTGMTSVLAHLGGAAYGLTWHRWGDMVERIAQRRRLDRAEKAREVASADRREMDRILGKIQTGGLSSLDSHERTFLERRSRELRGGR